MDTDSDKYVTIAGKDGIISRVPIEESIQEHCPTIKVPCGTCRYKNICKFKESMTAMIARSDLINVYPYESKMLKDIAVISIDCRYRDEFMCGPRTTDDPYEWEPFL